jgi:hypothetical protein
VRKMLVVAALVSVPELVVGCGGGSSNGGGQGTKSKPQYQSASSVVRQLNAALPGETFSAVKAFTNEVNIASAGTEYGSFTIIVSKPGHPLSESTWGKGRIPFTARLRSGDFQAYGYGIKGGICEAVKAYPGNIGIIWLVVTKHSSCVGVVPRGNNWAVVDQTLSGLK